MRQQGLKSLSAPPSPPGADIRTPSSRPSLLLGQTVSGTAARLGARWLRKPVRLGRTVLVAGHRDVEEVLRRDLDFRIAPVNAGRIEEVNGPFILGMDRSDVHARERHALYDALSAVDLSDIMAAAEASAAARIAGVPEGGVIDAVADYARPVAGETARRLFGVSGPDEIVFLDAVRAVFAHTFLNLGGDTAIQGRALRGAALMRTWLVDEIRRRRAAGVTGADLMGALMRQLDLDDDGVRRMLGGMLVGSIDTTASSVARILAVMGRDPRLLALATRDAGDETLTLGWCREALRRWPHNPLVLRQTVAATVLNGVTIPADSKVFAWTQAAMNDAQAFPDPHCLRPDRPARAYLHFGGGLHPCAGRAVNDRQIPVLVANLLRRGVARVGPIAWAGPFPDRLPLTFRTS